MRVLVTPAVYPRVFEILTTLTFLMFEMVCRTGAVSTGLWQKKGDIRPSNQMEFLIHHMVRRTAVRKVFSHQRRDLECFCRWQTYLLSLCVLLSQQSHLFLKSEVSTYK